MRHDKISVCWNRLNVCHIKEKQNEASTIHTGKGQRDQARPDGVRQAVVQPEGKRKSYRGSYPGASEFFHGCQTDRGRV